MSRTGWIPAAGLVLALACAAPGVSPAQPAAPSPSGGAAAASPATTAAATVAATPAPATATRGCDDAAGCYGDPVRVGTFDAEVVPEASGLVASRANPGFRWLIGDGSAERVYALDETGAIVAEIRLGGLDSRDTEDLALGPCPQGTCLYIGDIGSNDRDRSTVQIARLPEPDLSQGPPSGPVPTEVATYAYPGGQAADAEALLVDAQGAPLLVTKEPDGARLLAAEAFTDGELVDRGAVPVPEPATGLLSVALGGVMVTAADAVDGRVLLRTYDHVVEYVAPEPSAPLRDFPTWPAREVPAVLEPQGEAVAWDVDGRGYATVSERIGDVWVVRRTD